MCPVAVTGSLVLGAMLARATVSAASGEPAPPSGAGPSAIPGLALWLRADAGVQLDADGRVATWTDQSPGAAVLSQNREEWRPAVVPEAVNGLPAIRFQGREEPAPEGGLRYWGNPLVCPDFSLRGAEGATIVAVARDHGGAYLPTLVALKGLLSVARHAKQSPSLILPGGLVLDRDVGSLHRAGFVILQAEIDAKGAGLFANGLLLAASDTGMEPDASKGLFVGGLDGYVRRGCFHGELAELLIFNRRLAGDERGAITRYLQRRYRLGSVTTSLAGALPFAYYPSSNEIAVAFDASSPLVRLCLDEPAAAVSRPGDALPGLAFAYFAGPWKTQPKFSDLEPLSRGVAEVPAVGRCAADGEMRFRYAVDYAEPGAMIKPPPGGQSRMVYTGFLEIPKDGVYTFYLRPHAQARLAINGRDVAHNANAQTFNWRGGLANLAAGSHHMRLESVANPPFSLEFGQTILQAAPPGGDPLPLPADWLWHNDTSVAECVSDATGRTATASSARVSIPAAEEQVTVRVIRIGDPPDAAVLAASLPLDGQGRGQTAFKLPVLTAGDYRVEYLFRGRTIPATQRFLREYFPFEGNGIGREDRIYSPFEPVVATGSNVTVVGRTYRMNSFGLCDRVESLGRELLAAPMTIRYLLDNGLEGTWSRQSVTLISATDTHAEFSGEAIGDAIELRARSVIEEDGVVSISITLRPGIHPRPIARLWMEIPLRDREMPLFHYAGDNAIRLNYGGRTPVGSDIQWDVSTMPVHWRAATAAAAVSNAAGAVLLWDSRSVTRHGGNRGEFPLVPYLWLGAEERGLAWFAGSDRGFVTGGKPLQTLHREGDAVVLRIEAIQFPVTLTAPTEIRCGIQASPAKPMPEAWRTAEVATGIGPVVCWGGYLCSSKYPDNRDFTIVDKIVEAGKTGRVDVEWFTQKASERTWNDWQVLGDWPWLDAQINFANRMTQGKRSGCYFEEHITLNRQPEWQIFQDEWSSEEFNRFQPSDHPFTTSASSYQDFCLYYAREFNRRGVSLYFDNTFPQRSRNPLNATAWRGPLGAMIFANPILERRDYYRRMWKLARSVTQQGTPVDLTFHMTNTKVLPWSTWTTATLDNEATFRPGTHDETGLPRPWPPDYVRAVTLSRQSGSIAFTLCPLLNRREHDFYTQSKQKAMAYVSDWGMCAVHEMRGRTARDTRIGAWHTKQLAWFGYGAADVEVGTYWEERPQMRVASDDVKWLLVRKPAAGQAMVVLQSYRPALVSAAVTVPSMPHFLDVRTRETFSGDATGAVEMPLPKPYGTRLLLAAERPDLLPPPLPEDAALADDFEMGIHLSFFAVRPDSEMVVEDPLEAGNHLLRFGRNKRFLRLVSDPLTSRCQEFSDFELRFRMRISQPVLSIGNTRALLIVRYGISGDPDRGGSGFETRIDLGRPQPTAAPVWMVDPVQTIGKPGVSDAWKRAEVWQAGIGADAQWHEVTIRVAGRRHTLLFDGTAVGSGEFEHTAKAAGCSIGTACFFGGNDQYVDIDDVAIFPWTGEKQAL